MEKENPYSNEIAVDKPTAIEVVTRGKRYCIYIANGEIEVSACMESIVIVPGGSNRVTVSIKE